MAFWGATAGLLKQGPIVSMPGKSRLPKVRHNGGNRRETKKNGVKGGEQGAMGGDRGLSG